MLLSHLVAVYFCPLPHDSVLEDCQFFVFLKIIVVVVVAVVVAVFVFVGDRGYSGDDVIPVFPVNLSVQVDVVLKKVRECLSEKPGEEPLKCQTSSEIGNALQSLLLSSSSAAAAAAAAAASSSVTGNVVFVVMSIIE